MGDREVSTEIVGPLREGVIHFGSWPNTTALPYVPPANTLDPRYAACADHHPACDCREAEFAEELGEWRLQSRQLKQAIGDVLAGHLTESFHADRTPCQCTGCQIVRRAHLTNWAGAHS